MLLPLILTAAVFALSPVDDVIPSAIEAALLAPDDPISFGLPELLEAEQLSGHTVGATGRCVLAVGDVTGDGLADYAVGFGPGTSGHTLAVLDSVTGQSVWSVRPAGGTFRSLRGLALDGNRLALGVSSKRGSVQVRDVATGALVWGRTLATIVSSESANVSSVDWCPDLNGDGVADLLVAGGGRIRAAFALSGADGSILWKHALDDVVADAVLAHDFDGDGLGDVLIVGGELTPFARLLSSADGSVLWNQALDALGSVALGVDDINGDQVPDVVVGLFAEPARCVLALDGASGGVLWSSQDMTRNVTSLALMHDTLGTGLRDVAVGSFDNAISVLLAFNGGSVWRREASTFNGGSMFSVAVAGDLDGNGSLDVLSSCLDHRVYLIGGTIGQFMGQWESGQKLAAVAALPDVTQDGRPEVIAVGNQVVAVLDGAMGLASGPQLVIDPPATSSDTLRVVIWSYPTTLVTLWASLGTDLIPVPGVVGAFGLDLDSLVTLHQGQTPGAGAVALNFGTLPAAAMGLDVWMQALSRYSPSHAILSNVDDFTVFQ